MATQKSQTFGLITEPTKMKTFIVVAQNGKTYENIWTKSFKANNLDNLRKNLIATYRPLGKDDYSLDFDVYSGGKSRTLKGTLHLRPPRISRWITKSSDYWVNDSTGALEGRW